MSIPGLFRRAGAGALAAALFAMAGCALQPGAAPAISPAAAPPIPAGQARLWFYRDYQPSVSFNYANINVNGARIVSVAATGPGTYRDVAPGQYRIMPEDYVSAPNQGMELTVGPGDLVYLQVEDSPLVWGDMTNYVQDVFTVRPVPAAKALYQIARSPQ